MERLNEKISWEEAEAIVRMHRAATRHDNFVSLTSVARTLNISEPEAEELLSKHRSNLPAQFRSRFVDKSGIWSAGLALVAVLLILACASWRLHPRTAITSRMVSTVIAHKPHKVVSVESTTVRLDQRRLHILHPVSDFLNLL